jgi:methylphosphotriester-DNA--protein-cysteine methyltransferase
MASERTHSAERVWLGVELELCVKGKAMRLAVWQQLKHDMHVEIQQARRISNLMARKLLSQGNKAVRDVSRGASARSNSALERVLLQHYGGAAARPVLQ